ncbi:hypothetical protein CMUS01_14326 [Colletotrichum musicola]|uniref:Uncharacterized protein n=1 Tax=Colletotrichum musicola TaxID=2175873 RepID=A0A8H6MSF2_9PEZI|nr:hypothetical protein CMUS01_14326 [Colletotrichum musicola]
MLNDAQNSLDGRKKHKYLDEMPRFKDKSYLGQPKPPPCNIASPSGSLAIALFKLFATVFIEMWKLTGAVFAIFALASVTLGLVLPELEDGIWVAQFHDGTGEDPTWTKLADIPPDHLIRRDSGGSAARSVEPFMEPSVEDRSVGSSVDKRDQTGCTWRTADPVYYAFAFQTFWNQCAKGFVPPPRGVGVVTVGNVYWYVCNYNYARYDCNQNDMSITLHSVEYSCGKGITGWDHLDVPNVTWGVELTEAGVCNNL